MIGFYDYTVVVTYISLCFIHPGYVLCDRREAYSGSILSGFFRTV